MRLSARNKLEATVDTVTHGEVLTTVGVTLPHDQHVTAATTNGSVDLGFAVGSGTSM